MKAISRYWAVRNGYKAIIFGLEVIDFATGGGVTQAIKNAMTKAEEPPSRLQVKSERGEPR